MGRVSDGIMERVSYLIRRLLLVIPTFIGITVVCFALTRFLPGGPVEMRLMRMKGLGSAAAENGGGTVLRVFHPRLFTLSRIEGPCVLCRLT